MKEPILGLKMKIALNWKFRIYHTGLNCIIFSPGFNRTPKDKEPKSKIASVSRGEQEADTMAPKINASYGCFYN